MTNTFTNRQKYTIRQSAAGKNGKGMHTQLKAMAIVLTVAFAVAAAAAVWVSAMVKNRTAESHLSALPVVVNAGSTNPAPEVIQPVAGPSVTIFQGNGKTGNGFDWTYSADSGCAKITCDYDPAKEVYTFAASGITPGTDHVELMYKASDDTWKTVPLTLNIDKTLNTTIS